MLLAFQRAIIWRSQSLIYEVGAPCEVKGGATDAEFGSMTFEELLTLDGIILTLFFVLFY